MMGTYIWSMKQIVWEKVLSMEWPRCMTSWGMREHCMFLPVETLPLFSVSVLWECVVELCLVTLCTVSRTMGSVFLYCIWHWRYSHDDMLLSLQGGGTALMKASEREHMECVNVLLDKGAQVNIQNNVSSFWDNQLWHIHLYGGFRCGEHVGNKTQLCTWHTCLVPLLPGSTKGEEVGYFNCLIYSLLVL